MYKERNPEASSGTLVNAGVAPSVSARALQTAAENSSMNATQWLRPAFMSRSSEQPRQETRLAGHCRAIVRIGGEHALFRGEPLRQDSNVRERSCCRGDPGRVNQRKSEHLRKDRRIVRMANVAKGSGGHHAQARRIHHLNVPVFPERAYDPPTHRVCR